MSFFFYLTVETQDEIFQLAWAAVTTTVSHSLLTKMCSSVARPPLSQLGVGGMEGEKNKSGSCSSSSGGRTAPCHTSLSNRSLKTCFLANFFCMLKLMRTVSESFWAKRQPVGTFLWEKTLSMDGRESFSLHLTSQSSFNCLGKDVFGCCGTDRGNSTVNDGVQSTLCLPKTETRLETLSSREVKDVGNHKFASY